MGEGSKRKTAGSKNTSTNLWTKGKASRLSPRANHHHNTMNNEWEKRFDEEWTEECFFSTQGRDEMKSYISSLLSSQRANWLRSEIEKLEEIRDSIEGFNWDSDERGKKEILEIIITRYKEELLELEKGV